MTKAILVTPANIQMGALQQVLSTFPDLSPRLVIDGLGVLVDVPDTLIASVASLPEVATLATGPIDNSQDLPILPEAIPWIEAWNQMFDPFSLTNRASRAFNWSDTSITGQAVNAISPPPTIMTLTGDIAVGIVIVNGPEGSTAQITSSEFININLAIIHGLDILYNNAPTSAKLGYRKDSCVNE